MVVKRWKVTNSDASGASPGGWDRGCSQEEGVYPSSGGSSSG